jgi:hypothetical protein
VSKQDFRQGNQENYFLIMAYSRQFNNVIEALNLVLEKYLAEIQLLGNITVLLSMHSTEFYTEFWHGLPLKISITSCELQIQLQLTVAGT